MSLFTGAMRLHVDGRKDLTNHTELVKIAAGKKVYIPLVNMNSVKVDVLVNEGDHVYVGQKIAVRNDHFTVPLFSSVSGTVAGKEKRMHSCCKLMEHLVIENDGLYEKKFDMEPLDPETATVDELVTFMTNMGLVGCGGAGFPTYVKYKGVKGIHTLIINGVECEPYITADYRAIELHTDLLIKGTKTMKKMCGATKAVIAIKESKKELIEQVQNALKDVEGVELCAVPDVYPMGWERTLVYQVCNVRYEKLPSEVGIVVDNATTAIAFAKCLTTGEPIVDKYVTFSGEALNHPANVLVPVGVPVGDIIAELGGFNTEECYLIAGGPMMGRTIPMDKFVVHPYMNAVTVLKYEPTETLGCLRCGRCVDYCPSGLQPVRINTANKIKDVDMLEQLSVMSCIECGMCTYVCPSHIQVTEGIRKAKATFMAAPKKKGGKK
ncbi:MAG: RnfABCDGE type electron transport complex subunit C [Erysipelotrichaceae bacterium]|nr:RnfABCDGE type electron transport complex subunit C [Erysipelotrichaceae bacterium]